MPAATNDTRQAVELRGIPAVSPSLAEVLANCPLQAGLSRIPELRRFVLSNPKTWLGTAYHEVLEELWTEAIPDTSGDDLIEHLWQTAIEKLRQRALTHPLDSRFVSPERWPGYHLAHAFVQIRARQAIAEAPRPGHPSGMTSGTPRIVREQQLTALDGKIIGKPDVIFENEVRDYKSGSIYEQSDEGQQIVKQSYVRQLRIYGHLVHVNMGRCPSKGKLLPMQGSPVDIDLDPASCAQAAGDAVAVLDSFNAALAIASQPAELATPSPNACRWCQFKALCPAFWQQVDTMWAEPLGSAAIRGVLRDAPSLIHNGRAYSVTMDILSGTATGCKTVGPLDCEVHSHIAAYQAGDIVRLINLYARRDGQLVPTAATVCFGDTACPTISIAASQGQEASN